MARYEVTSFRPRTENEAEWLEIKEWAAAHRVTWSHILNAMIPALREALYNQTIYDEATGDIKFVSDLGIIKVNK